MQDLNHINRCNRFKVFVAFLKEILSKILRDLLKLDLELGIVIIDLFEKQYFSYLSLAIFI